MQVPLGIIPKNEAKREELIEIMELLHEYVPSASSIVPVRFRLFLHMSTNFKPVLLTFIVAGIWRGSNDF
jgi:hypothetical protein